MDQFLRCVSLFGVLPVLIAAAALLEEENKPSPKASAVSWQSAFWALVPLAMNSMTQPAGRVCFMSSEYGAFLRCSPIICAIDTVIILEQQIWLTIATGSPFVAARELVTFRFQAVANDQAEGSFENLQKNTTFRLGMFFVGAMPQAIKLYSMHGLMSVKLVGTAYLSSFVVVEMVGIAARFGGRWEHIAMPRDPRPEVEDFIGFVAVASSLLYNYYIFALGFTSATQQYVKHLN